VDNFEGTRKFGSDGKHLNPAESGLPHFMEQINGGLLQKVRGVNSAARLRQEGAFQMDTEWSGPAGAGVSVLGDALDKMAEFPEGAKGCIHRSGYGRWAVAGYAMLSNEAFDGFEGVIVALHHVVTGASMDVKIDKSGR
jgi:hypothetical protein